MRVVTATKFKETEIGTIPEEWEVVGVDNFCSNMSSGGTPSRQNKDYYKNGKICWIKTGELKDSYIYDTEEKITEDAIKNSSARIFPKNTISLAMYGATVGKLGILGIEASTNQACCNMVINVDSDFKFLFYSLLNKREELIGRANGAAQQNLSVGTIKSFKLVKPPLYEQKQIAEILSSLDDKIELNRQINANLEKIASSLFKHWFVDFEFLDKNGKSYKSSGGKMVDSELGEIPEGWRICKLEEVLEALESGKRPKGGSQEFGVPSIGAENINGLGYYDFSSTKYVNEDYYNKMNNGKVKDYDIMLYKDGAYIGKKTMFGLGFPFDNCCINEHVFILRTNSNRMNQFYLYFYLNQNDITEKIKHLNTNSAQPGINKESLRNLKILLPNNDFVDHYKIITQPLIDLILKNSLQNKQLSELRDSLLPRLMNGKLRVKI